MRQTSHPRNLIAGWRGCRATFGQAGRALLGLALLACSGPASASLQISDQSLQFGRQEVGTTSAARSIKITNDDNAPVVIFAVSIGGNNAGDFLLVASNCGWLNPRGGCAIGVQFKPQAEGNRSAQLTIISTAAGSPHVVDLQGQGTELRYTLSPSQFDFGDQVVGQESAPLIVTLTNTGSADLQPDPVFDGNGSDFTLLPGCAVLRPGDSCQLRVVFKPSSVGPRNAVLTLSRARRGTRAKATHLALTGYGIDSSLRLSTRRLDFGVVAVDTPRELAERLTVTVANVGSAPVRTSWQVVDLPNRSASDKGGFGPAGVVGAAVIAPQGSITITVTFAPLWLEDYFAVLSIQSASSGKSYDVELVGSGGPVYSLSPSELDFGDQEVGTQSAPLTVTVTNLRNSELKTQQVLTGGNEFVILSDCAKIPARGTCRLEVTFRPQRTGPREGHLQLLDGPASFFPTLRMTGHGVDPRLRLSTQRLDFGVLAVGSKEVEQTVTLTNAGSTPISGLAVRFVFVLGKGNDDIGFTITPGCGGLAVGQSCSIRVVFEPKEARDYSAELVITADAMSRPLRVDLAGTGGPAYSLSPPRLDFGDQEVGTQSAPRTVTITNLRNIELEPQTLFDGSATDFIINSKCQKLPAGGSCQFQVSFRPGRVGPTGAILHLLGRASVKRSGDYLIVAPPLELTGNGVPAGSLAPRYQSTPPPSSTLDAGGSPVGSPTTVTLPIENLGNAPLRIDAPTLTGANASDFRISSPATFPLTVGTRTDPGGGMGAIQIEFTPGGPGPRTATLELPTNDPNQPKARYTLTGTGVGARVSLSTGSISFGDQRVGTTSDARLLTITNTGNADLILNGVGFDGQAPDDFTLGAACGVVPPNGSCFLALRFTPRGPGSRTAELALLSNAAGSPSRVTLAGNGLAPALRIDPASLSFGPVNVGASVSLPLTLTNTGNAPLTIHSLTVGGEHPLDFQQAAQCPVLQPTETCQLLVAFAPQAIGPRSGTLAISSDAPGSPHVVALTGTGTGSDLSINLTATAQTDAQGVQITYTLTVSSNGTHPVQNVRIQHQLPAESGFESVSAGGALVVTPAVGESGTATFQLDQMAAQDQVTFQVVVRLGANPPAAVSSSADVAAATPDVNPANNSVQISTPVPGN